MPNRLASETSPYLLQHAHNPVDWYPWGAEALDRATAEDRPIFLSIGYSACHWCHVMERESFEHAAIADCLNEHFISIKVDREERPDLDQIYMAAVMALRNGQGGWPLSAFLTPKLEVFFGGTYWPPSASRGMPGFDHVLNQVLKTYRTRREDVETQAGKLTRYLQDSLGRYRDDQEAIDASGLKRAVEQLDEAFDESHGGFGHAPKFPHAMDIQLLQRLELIWPSEERVHRERIQTMVQSTLNEMANGGIYDHLGGGFARYSTDDRWLVPHFEKMLYDNALLMSAYVDQWRRMKHPSDAQLIQQMAAFVEREMTDECGAFYSTLDADSEGIEGQYYVWTDEEIRRHLPVEVADFFCEAYGVTPAGNFEGKSVLFRSTKNSPRDSLRAVDDTDAEVTLGDCRAKLFAVREQRIRPATDTKILVSWNALMIDALARAAAATSDDKLLQMATRAASAIRDGAQNADGALLHQLDEGEAGTLGFLDDYAYLIVALVSLYQVDGQVAWLEWAINLADRMLKDFGDEGSGGFFYTSQRHEALIARTKDFQDSSVPSGNAMAALGLLRLYALTGKKSYEKAAASTLRAGRALWSRSPAAAGQLLIALDAMVVGITQLVFFSGKDPTESQEVLKAIQQTYLPRALLVIHSPDNEIPSALRDLLDGRSAINQEPTLYVCEKATCRQPAVGTAAIMAELEKLQNPTSLKFD